VDKPGARSSFRPDIEGLRAIAILTVVLYHYNLFHVRGGFIGVDVFFVISGFLITGQLVNAIGGNGARALPGFYARRIKRLLPAASVTLLATVIAWRIWGLITLPRETPMDAVFAAFYGLNYRLAHTGTQYFNPLFAPPPLQHFWSLAVEEQFYLLWPLLILLAFWHQGRRRRRNLAVALCIIGAISLVLSWRLSGTQPTWSFYGLHTRAWELATGGIIALSAHRLSKLPPRAAAPLTWLGLLAIVVAALKFTDDTTYPGVAAVLPVAGAMLVVAGGCVRPALGAGLILNRRPAQTVGRLSYSWYLWHFPVILIAPLALGHGVGRVTRAALLVVSFGIAALSYKLVEQPLRRQQWQPSRWFALAAGSAAIVGVVALLAIAFPRPAVGPGPAVSAPHLAGTLQEQEAQLKQAVRAALASDVVPDNLSPDLAHAHDDGPSVPGDCFLGFSATKTGSCVFGDPAARRTAVMFGDSSVQQWFDVADRIGKENHWRLVLWGKASCSINNATILSSLTALPYHSCLTFRNQTIARINALHPDAVIAGEFPGYGLGLYSAQQWASYVVATMRELSAPGRTVTYLMPDAVPVRDMPTCLATHLTDQRACTIPTDIATRPRDRVRLELSMLKEAGIPIAYPAGLMCAAEGCPAIVANVPVYRDAYHVTSTYAQLLAPLFERLLPPPDTTTPATARR
jgi:peptidoglycan/LPS O-acetylase OafA/YrhL